MIFPRLVLNLGVFETLKRMGSRLLQPGRVSVKNLLLNPLVCLEGGSIASKIASIYFSDPGQKVKGGFGVYGNGLLNALLLDIFLTAILLGLDTD